MPSNNLQLLNFTMQKTHKNFYRQFNGALKQILSRLKAPATTRTVKVHFKTKSVLATNGTGRANLRTLCFKLRRIVSGIALARILWTRLSDK